MNVQEDIESLFKTVKVPEELTEFKLKSQKDSSDDKCLSKTTSKVPVDLGTPQQKDTNKRAKASSEMSLSKAKMTKTTNPKGGDVDSITKQMKELVKMNMMIQSKLSSLESSLSEAQKKELEANNDDEEDLTDEVVEDVGDELSEEVIEDSDDDDEVVELPEEEKEEVASELVDISMDEEEEEERDDLTIEEEKAPAAEDILDRESRELLESESFEEVKEDLVEEKKEIKEDDEVYLGHQMDEDDYEEEEAKFNVEVKWEMVKPTSSANSSL